MPHLYPIKTKVDRDQRVALLKQRPLVIWFTGLSGSGKSTLAVQLEANLAARGYKTYLLDGDNIRTGLNKDLSFSDDGRIENIRRIGEVAKLFVDAGIIVLTAFISPFRSDREHARQIIGSNSFMEVYVDCPIEVCEQRDVKGLYKKARTGEVANFTGIDSPYEAPDRPDLIIKTSELSVEASQDLLISAIEPKIAV